MPFFCYNKNDYCDHSENCDNCNVWVHGKGGKEVPTNADRIRAMSDEELSVFLWEFDKEEIARTEYALERRKITEWLKQPAEE